MCRKYWDVSFSNGVNLITRFRQSGEIFSGRLASLVRPPLIRLWPTRTDATLGLDVLCSIVDLLRQVTRLLLYTITIILTDKEVVKHFGVTVQYQRHFWRNNFIEFALFSIHNKTKPVVKFSYDLNIVKSYKTVNLDFLHFRTTTEMYLIKIL